MNGLNGLNGLVPLRTLDLPPAPESVSEARHVVAAAVRDLPEQEDLVDVAALLVSELVTNAVLHGRDGVRVRAFAGAALVRVEVADGSPVLPRQRNADIDGTTGRGLSLVAALASRWGSEPLLDRNLRKVVWFELDRSSVRSPHPTADLVFDLDAIEPCDTGLQALACRSMKVTLLRTPLRLFERAESYNSELMREFALIAVGVSQGERSNTPTRLLRLVEMLSERYAQAAGSVDAQRQQAVTEHRRSADLVYDLPPEAGPDAGLLGALLDEAQDHCLNGDLMTLRAPEDVLAFQRWYTGEHVRQLRGELPCPWAGGLD